MPGADTVWLTPLDELLTYLERAGPVVRWHFDSSRDHLAVADSLITAFTADATAIAAQVGGRALEELLAAHGLWSEWLREGLPDYQLHSGPSPGPTPRESGGVRPRGRSTRGVLGR